MVDENERGAQPPFFAVVEGGERLAPLRVVVMHLLERHGLGVIATVSRDEAIERARDPSCVLVVDLSGDPGPIATALGARALPVVVAAGQPRDGTGAGAIILEPSRLVASLRSIVAHALEVARVLARLHALARPDVAAAAPTAADLGLRPASARTNELARTIAAHALDARPVLVQGPAGSGKKHVARLLHTLSARRNGPLVVLDAATATTDEAATAHGGTLVLTGVERLSSSFAPALATLVEERRIGDRAVDARVVLLARDDPLAPFASAAPRAVLEAAYVLRLPALHEHPEELIALVDELVEAEARKRGQHVELGFEALESVLTYPWPGGIRELQSAAEHAVRAASGAETILPEHLPPTVQRATGRPGRAGPTLASVVEAVERALIARSIVQHRGRLEEVSRSLGVAPRTLRRKILQHGLRQETANLRRSA